MQKREGAIQTFSAEEFFSPSLSFSPVYTWTWDAPLSKEETARQIEEMRRLGIKRFYVLPLPSSFRPKAHPTLLSPDYLSDGFFAEYRFALEKAKEAGMDVWLYDEGGWPSGGACGAVVKKDPTLAREVLRARSRALRKGKPYLPSADAVAAFKDRAGIRKGDRFDRKTEITEYYKERIESGGDSANIPDLTKKQSAETFLSLTHDAYEKAVGDFFGETITAVFTDEPTAPRPFPYREEIAERFLARFGFDIRDYLPALFEPKTREEKEIRIKYLTLCAELFAENYLQTEKDWCEKRGLLFLGHFDKDDEANGALSGGSFDLLRALGKLDVPGVDAIWRQIFPPRKGEIPKGANGFFPRLASSAAAQKGNRRALTESFAVYGNGLTFEEMRYVLSFQAMRGINLYNLMMFSYGRTGFLRTGELPHFSETHGCYRDLAAFNAFAERLSYLFSVGERVAPVALYYPLRDAYAGDFAEKGEAYLAAGKLLEEKRISFDILSDDGLASASVESGALFIGRARYEAVVLTPCEFLSPEAVSALEAFAEKGGKVLCLKEENAREIKGAAFDPALNALSSSLEIEGEGVALAESKTRNGEFFFLMNESAEAKTCRVRLPEKKCYRIDPFVGKIFAPKTGGELSLTLCSGEIAALLITEEKLPCEEPFRGDEPVPISDFSFRKTERFVIGKDDFRKEVYSESFRSVSLGDWRKIVGKGYSGSGEYRATFSLPEIPERLFLDLGRVDYSCEVFLNGVSVGTLIAPPYKIELPKELLKEENEIVVRVTNSAANEFEHTRAFKKYKKNQLTRYLPVERKFHKSSLSGGLFGPVRLLK